MDKIIMNNDLKRSLHPYIDNFSSKLYQEVAKEIFYNYISFYIKELERLTNESFTEPIAKKSFESVKNQLLEILDLRLVNNNNANEIKELFLKRLQDIYAPKAKIWTEDCIKYLIGFESDVISEDIDKYSSLDIYPYENQIKILSTLLDVVFSLIEKSKNKEIEKLIVELRYDELVEHIFSENRSFLKKLLHESFSESEHIKSGAEKTGMKLSDLFKIKITDYFEQTSKIITDAEAIILEVIEQVNKDLANNQNIRSDGDECAILSANNPNSNPENTLLKEKHFEIKNGEKNITYEILFGEFLTGAKSIILIEPYLQGFSQYENLLQFCKLLINIRSINKLHIITKYDKTKEIFPIKEKLADLEKSLKSHNIELTFKFSQIIHDREIICDNGWIIEIGRGLHIYQPPEKDDLSKFDAYFRMCRQTKVHIYKQENYIKEDQNRTKAA